MLQRRCACGQHTHGEECEDCRKQRGAVQQRAATRSQTPPPPGDAAPRSDRDLATTPPGSSTGRALEPAVAERFRPSLGSLIDRVRVHDGEQGARFAGSQGAVAVTTGADVYFARGAYRPSSDAGRALLAHELAHVHQQHSPDGPPAGFRSTLGDRYEREADRFAATGHLRGAAGAARRAGGTSDVVQAKGGSFTGFWSKVGRTLLNVVTFGQVDLGFRDSVLTDYLEVLKAGTIEDDFDSDNKARDVVRKRARLGPFTTTVKRLLVEEMLAGATFGDDEDAIIALLRDTPQAERMQIVHAIGRDRLWGNFSFGNRRTIEGLTLEAADFRQAGTVSRLEGLSTDDLQDYLSAADDPAVRSEIEKLIALKNITTPLADTQVGLGFQLTAAGGATFSINGFDVTVLPDGTDQSLGNFATTGILFRGAGPDQVMLDPSAPGRPITSFTPPPPIAVTIQTRYGPEASSSISSSGGAGYGRGTTTADVAAGQTSLRFHESHHGRDAIEFLRDNPPPRFTGAVGMSEEAFRQATDAYQTAVAAYHTRISEFTTRRTDCPGTPISGDILSRFGLRATICQDAP